MRTLLIMECYSVRKAGHLKGRLKPNFYALANKEYHQSDTKYT